MLTGLLMIPTSTLVIPEMPSVHEDQASLTVLPIGDNMPKPVTTTLLCSCFI